MCYVVQALPVRIRQFFNMKKLERWNQTRQFIVLVCFLVLISSSSFFISSDKNESHLISKPTKSAYMSKLKETLERIVNSFNSDPFTSLDPLQVALDEQETVLNNIKVEFNDILQQVPISLPYSSIVSRSLKSASELPNCPNISPYLHRVLSVNQVDIISSYI